VVCWPTTSRTGPGHTRILVLEAGSYICPTHVHNNEDVPRRDPQCRGWHDRRRRARLLDRYIHTRAVIWVAEPRSDNTAVAVLASDCAAPEREPGQALRL
jgi:hypothetical protein